MSKSKKKKIAAKAAAREAARAPKDARPAEETQPAEETRPVTDAESAKPKKNAERGARNVERGETEGEAKKPAKGEKMAKAEKPVKAAKGQKGVKADTAIEAKEPVKAVEAEAPVEAAKPEKPKKNAGQGETEGKAEGPGKAKKPAKGEKVSKAENPVKAAKAQKGVKAETAVEAEEPVEAAKPEEPKKNAERGARNAERGEAEGKAEESGKAKKPAKVEKVAKAEKPVKAAKGRKGAKVETAVEAEKPVEAEMPVVAEKPGKAKRRRGGNGEMHVQAEAVPMEGRRKLFKPNKIELPMHGRVNRNFLEYASYVIRDRAIPKLEDGLKPVQRRILWALHTMDEGRFIKVANVVGESMKYHPHGDASIGDALVVLTNKRYLIEGQGNFGNIYTGDVPAAPRYIECRLTDLARSEVFNDEITEFIPTYDGSKKEPVTLPCKLPLLLMLGTEGIAVGLSAKILPHNFPELLQAQINILKKEPFKVLPDFFTGGLMDARGYADGKGTIRARAKIKIKDGFTVAIKEIPPTTTTDSLMASIEDASRKGKIKVRSVNDFTSEEVEIEVKAPPGVEAEQLVDALYAFTDCEVTIASRIVVIKNNRPVEMTVSEVLRENTDQLVELLKRELELREKQLQDDLHFRTLERIFIEERIYKKIEQCRTNEAVTAAVHEGFRPFAKELLREMVDTDVERLLAVRIRRISLFDINKHREEVEKVKADLAETRKNLKNLTKYVIAHLESLLEKYGPLYPRLTKTGRFDEVEAKEVAFKTFKVAYDRESGYVGHKVNGEEFKMDCSSFDKLILVSKDGRYRVTELPEKLFVGPDLVYCALPERERVFTLVYTNRDANYLKRFAFGGTILDKEYFCIPEKSRILFFEPDTPEELYIRYKPAPHQKVYQQTCKPSAIAVKGVKSRGNQISAKEIATVSSKPLRNWDAKAATTKVVFA